MPVTRGGDNGALVRFEKTGRYAQVMAAAIRAVAAALGTGGWPAALDAGQRARCGKETSAPGFAPR